MRAVLLAYVGTVITIILVAIISCITIKSSYMDLIENNLDDSIMFAVRSLQTDRSLLYESDYYDFSGSETPHTVAGSNVKRGIDWSSSSLDGFKKDFVDYLTANIDSRVVELDVDFYGADEKNGLLSVKVTGHFVYPFGVTGEVSTYKTVILDKYVKP